MAIQATRDTVCRSSHPAIHFYLLDAVAPSSISTLNLNCCAVMSYLTSEVAPEVFESITGTPFWLWNGQEYVKLAGEQLRKEMKLWDELPAWHRKIRKYRDGLG